MWLANPLKPAFLVLQIADEDLANLKGGTEASFAYIASAQKDRESLKSSLYDYITGRT